MKVKIKLHHFVYKTTNKINGKFYIGKHSTNNINDNYIGSGKLLKKAIIKYGFENFGFEILESFESSDDAYKYEKELITQLLIDDDNCYNVKYGGIGRQVGDKLTQQSKDKIRNHVLLLFADKRNHPMYGRKHTPETKIKMSTSKQNMVVNYDSIDAMAKVCRGSKYYNNGIETRRFKPDNVPDGWSVGRMPYKQENRKPLTDDMKNLISNTLKGRPVKVNSTKIQCPHCGKIADLRNIRRWHLDNCKIRKINESQN